MQLTKKQFDVLTLLSEKDLSQRELEEKTGYSLGTINKVIKELRDLSLLKVNTVQRIFADVSKRCMSQIVPQGNRFDKFQVGRIIS